MKAFLPLLLLVLCVGGFMWSLMSQKTLVKKGGVASQASGRGFKTIAATPDTPPDKVVIIAPVNCPREEGRRADALERLLLQAGLPTVRREAISFAASSQAALDQANGLMNGELPIVFVGQRAMNNPTAEEVSAEFASRQSK